MTDKSKVGRPREVGKPRAVGKPRSVRRRQDVERPAEDPLAGVEYTSDPETNAALQLSAVEAGFRKRAAEERKRMKAATSLDYFSVLVFEDGDQAAAFWREVARRFGPIPVGTYVDGRLLADLLEIPLPTSPMRYNPPRQNPELAHLTIDAPDGRNQEG